MAPIENDQAETMRILLSFLDEIYPILLEYTYTDKLRAGNIQPITL